MSDETMRMCEKRERDRERKKRKAKKREHLAGMVHYDFAKVEAQENSPAWLSDRGAGVEAIIRHCDGELGVSCYERRLEWARDLIKHHKPLRRSADVFELIVENGKNRKESICQLMLKKPRRGNRQRSCIGTT